MKVLLGQSHLASATTAAILQAEDNEIPADNLESDFNKDGRTASYAEGYPLPWDTEIWKFATKGDAVSGGVTSGSASPDEKLLALSTGQSVCFFALDDYKLVGVLTVDVGQVERVEFAPFPKGGSAGYTLAVEAVDVLGDGKSTVQVWHLAERGEIGLQGDGIARTTGGFIVDGHLATFSPTVFSRDGKTMLYLNDVHDEYGTQKQVTAMIVATGTEKFHMRGHSDSIMWAGFSPDDKLIVTSAWDGFAKLYDAKDGKHLRDLGPTGGQNWACDFSPDSKNLAVSRGSSGPSTFVWQPTDPQSFPTVLGGANGWQRVISWSPDGGRLAIGAGDGRLVVYDAKSMTLDQVWQLGEMPQRYIREVSGAEWLAGGKRLLFTPSDGSVQMYDFEQNKKWKWAPGEKYEWMPGSWFNTLLVLEKRGLFGSKDQDGAYRIWKLPAA